LTDIKKKIDAKVEAKKPEPVVEEPQLSSFHTEIPAIVNGDPDNRPKSNHKREREEEEDSQEIPLSNNSKKAKTSLSTNQEFKVGMCMGKLLLEANQWLRQFEETTKRVENEMTNEAKNTYDRKEEAYKNIEAREEAIFQALCQSEQTRKDDLLAHYKKTTEATIEEYKTTYDRRVAHLKKTLDEDTAMLNRTLEEGIKGCNDEYASSVEQYKRAKTNGIEARKKNYDNLRSALEHGQAMYHLISECAEERRKEVDQLKEFIEVDVDPKA